MQAAVSDRLVELDIFPLLSIVVAERLVACRAQ